MEKSSSASPTPKTTTTTTSRGKTADPKESSSIGGNLEQTEGGKRAHDFHKELLKQATATEERNPTKPRQEQVP